MRPRHAFLKRSVRSFAFANNRYAGHGLVCVRLFLQFFEENKIQLDLHRSSAQRRFAQFRNTTLKRHFHQPVFPVVSQNDFVPRLNLRARLDQGI